MPGATACRWSSSAPPGRSMRSSAAPGSTGSTPRATRARSCAATRKWDDQPASPAAAREAILRAAWIANTAPRGPTYVNLDAGMQEAKLTEPVPPIDAQRFMPEVANAPAADAIAQAAEPVAQRQAAADPGRPRLARSRRLERARRARRAAQCPRHHRHEGRRRLSRPIIRCTSGAPGTIAPTPDALEAIRAADVILSLDWLDLAGTLKHAGGDVDAQDRAGLARPSPAQWLEHGLSGPAAGRRVASPASRTRRCRRCSMRSARPSRMRSPSSAARTVQAGRRQAHRRSSGRCVAPRGRRTPCSLTHVSLSWNGASWPFRHPLDYLGCDGGGGVGGGPGISVGAALALKGSGRLPVAVCGDGDFLMGVTALVDGGALPHPAADGDRQQPLLLQRRAAPGAGRAHAQPPGREPLDRPAHFRTRYRPRRHGARARRARLRPGDARSPNWPRPSRKAIAAVEAGHVAVVDVRVEPGYTAAMTAVDDAARASDHGHGQRRHRHPGRQRHRRAFRDARKARSPRSTTSPSTSGRANSFR